MGWLFLVAAGLEVDILVGRRRCRILDALEGEVTLASAGVLLLDQLQEFLRQPLEMLREPLAQQEVTLTRAAGTISFPARALVVAAMQPCPCGYHRHPKHSCSCSAESRRRYEDRARGHRFFDIRTEVDNIELASPTMRGETAAIGLHVAAARAVQMVRQGKLNHELHDDDLDQHCWRGAVHAGDVDHMTYGRRRAAVAAGRVAPRRDRALTRSPPEHRRTASQRPTATSQSCSERDGV